jgi:hypothetical protein
MKKISNYPSISGSATRKPVAVNAEALKTSGIPFASYGIALNETIEFPDSWDDSVLYQQPVRPGSNAMQTLVGVLRNGKPSYISMGTLRRLDAHNEPTCPFTAEMAKMDNDYERLEALFGKKIKCTGSTKIDIQDFDRLTGTRLDTTHEGPAPIIEYV